MRYALWGWKADIVTEPIKLTIGTLRTTKSAQRSREAEGWLCAIYEFGTEPTGLRLQVVERTHT